ncbi:MAG: hypothetical protein J7K04_13840 [Spirochaetales bacterium]|nr:hypothetical protein [Spirochaetales bacterium]
MPNVEIKTVNTNRERLRFIKMPWLIYKNDPHWVPPIIADQKSFINPKKGVFFEHGKAKLFLAIRDGKPVGRISAHINTLHDEIYNDGKGFFGFFECENNQETADMLFRAAEHYLKSQNRKFVEGPMSFGIYDEIGLLVDGFDTDPYVLNVHNPEYYQKLVENAGYKKSVDWYAYRGATNQKVDEKMYRLKDRVMKQPGLTIRKIYPHENFKRDAAIVKHIFSTAWNKNWGHVPLTDSEFNRIAEELTRLVVPDLSFIAEINGQAIGFALSIYDANVAVKKINGRLFPVGFIKLLTNLKKTDRFRHILMGVLEEYRNRGIEIAFYVNIAEQAYKLGFSEIEMSLIVENNEPMRNSLKHLPVEIYKTYRIYTKDL